MDRIVIDQTKIRLRADIAAKIKPGDEFPRPLAWWQRITPIWLDVTEADGQQILLTPNGKVADGRVLDLTPARVRRNLQAGVGWLLGWSAIDFSDAITSSAAADPAV